MLKYIVGIVAITSVQSALSNVNSLLPNVRLGQVNHAGPGCPPGSVEVNFGANKQALHVTFKQFVVRSGGNTESDRANCTVAVPVQLPEGLQLRPYQYTLKGVVNFGEDASGSLIVENFLAGIRGPRIQRFFEEDDRGPFQVSATSSSLRWSECGKNAALRTSIGAQIVSEDDDSDGSALIDLREVNGAPARYVIQLEYRPCR